jgi:FMN reductase
MTTDNARPLIVGIGGTTRESSTSELALRYALSAAEKLGARTEIISGPSLIFPMFSPETSQDSAVRPVEVQNFIDLLRKSDAIIISSPGYHGSISGLLKNALDYVEDMRGDSRVYFEGRTVGCIACAAGSQASVMTLSTLRAIVHALRGSPTPLGVTVNSSAPVFDRNKNCLDPLIAAQLEMLASEVVMSSKMRLRWFDDMARAA